MSSATANPPPASPTRRKNFKISLPTFRRHHQSIASPARSSPQRKNKLHELQEIFHHFDADGDGKISAAELRAVFSSDREVASAALSWLDDDGDGRIGFADFVEMMTAEGESEVELLRTFEEFEGEKGSGRISPGGLQRVLRRLLGEEWTEEDCKMMIKPYDLDGDGNLSFSEFKTMMTS